MARNGTHAHPRSHGPLVCVLVRASTRGGGRPIRTRHEPRHRGKLLLSIQLVPVECVPQLPAGAGRSEPNKNPTLPKPVGRLKFSLNPFKMLSRLIGPKYCRELSKGCCCVLCVVITVLLLYYMLPVIFSNVITAPIVG